MQNQSGYSTHDASIHLLCVYLKFQLSMIYSSLKKWNDKMFWCLEITEKGKWTTKYQQPDCTIHQHIVPVCTGLSFRGLTIRRNFLNIGIKHDFLCTNICLGSREVLKLSRPPSPGLSGTLLSDKMSEPKSPKDQKIYK